MTLTQAYLKTLLHYNTESGNFTWLKSLSSTGQIGTKAGCIKSCDGYIQVQIHGKKYRAHRLAWFYTHGTWPKKHIDHIDHNPQNNSLENLRECNDSTNQANRRISRNNTSGYKGVYKCSKTNVWQCRIKKDGISYNLGRYTDKEQAAKAYADAAKKLFGEYAYTGMEYATINLSEYIR